MRRATSILVVLAVLVLGAGVALAGDCPAKKTANGLWCPGCSKVLDKPDIEGGVCKSCNEGKKGKDRVKPEKIKVCVRVSYACEAHPGSASAKPDKCEECKKPLAEKADFARVVYTCSNCGDEGKGAGKCKKPECKKAKGKFEAKCAKSGTAPHD